MNINYVYWIALLIWVICVLPIDSSSIRAWLAFLGELVMLCLIGYVVFRLKVS